MRSSSQREKTDVRLDRILPVVAELFREKGYVATSVRDIGEAVGLKQGALYYHIGSKENLLVALHDRFIEHYVSRLQNEVMEAQASPDDKLRRAILIAMEIIEQYQAEVTVFLREEHNLRGAERDRIVAQRDKVDRILDRVLKDGQKQGMFRNIDTRIARLSLLGMCNWAHVWFRPGGRQRSQHIAKQMADVYLHGVLEK